MAVRETPALDGSGDKTPVVDAGLYVALANWLYDESALLDAGRLAEWTELLTEDFTYQIPVRQVRGRGDGQELHPQAALVFEDRKSLAVRADRMSTEFNWSEDPPSMIRRHLSNLRIAEAADGEYEVRSGLLVVRSRSDESSPELLSGLRLDRLVQRQDGFLLRSRRVELDHAVLGSRNLPLPL